MTHELDTRLNRRVSHVSYVPEHEDDDELLALEEELEAVTVEIWKPNCFIRFVERFPYIIIILMLSSAGGCAALLYFYAPVPNFITGDDPTKGFETRGTEIHKRAWTLKNLNEHNNVDYFLMPNISIVLEELNIPQKVIGFGPFQQNSAQYHSKREERDLSSHNKLVGFGSCPGFILKDSNTYKFVIEPRHGQDLLSLANLKAWCELESEVILPLISPIRGLVSIPQLVLCMSNIVYKWHGCEAFTERSVTAFKEIMHTCAPHYYSKTLSGPAPALCTKNSQIIWQFFMYMAPIGFLQPGSVGVRESLGSALSYVDWSTMRELDPEKVYRKSFLSNRIQNDKIRIVAMNIPSQDDVKYNLFSDYLLDDLKKYFTLALGLILCIMMLYTKSVAMVLATVINVSMSFVFACAIYFFVCRLTFFPFINLLAGLVLIAVGADDIFIFYDTWKQIRTEKSQLSFAQSLSLSYKHATLSIFVTSFTTASAFFTNTISSTITTIRCFGIFAGIAIIVNFFVMVAWTPACIVCMEKLWQGFIGSLRSRSANSMFQKSVQRVEEFFDNRTSKITELACARFLPALVNKLWYVWIIILTSLGVGSCFVIFYKPKLQLPKSQDFQLFPDDNLLENWDLNFIKSFPYQIQHQQNDRIPLYVVFGFEPKDDGNWLDPDDPGSAITEDTNFDFYKNSTQMWLANFCADLKNQSFVDPHFRQQPCALPKYGDLFQQFCSIPRYASFLKQCCTQYKPPYTSHQLKVCLPALQEILGGNINLIGNIIYNSTNTVKGFMMFVYTNLNFSLSYDEMDKNYKTLKGYFADKFVTAPTGLRTGFFTGRYTFTFFDVQGAIARGTNLSILLSIAVAFGIMLITTMNLVITLYAIVAIMFSIICTVASIVLLGWHLNIIESITISLAIGLSIDFTVHYGVAYRLSLANEPHLRVEESFSRVGPAVAMAALTTFSAGAAMMPARVLAYTKLGTFLMLVMTFSWVYATFLFQSICRIIGPKGNCCQLRCAGCKKAPPSHRTLVVNPDDDDDSLITFS
ncbi:hypothetical protein LSH36_908g01058 [Paralvinella palmiformis]|uniref:SSD domain-containing protein n=1 Tax=Paralvinella palmiformis TaxID=53620 RepID=A0AAD9MR93_9ANNE|nr:hypothetical protein LSH36_908g01058 [Paralvinella palmiformis]